MSTTVITKRRYSNPRLPYLILPYLYLQVGSTSFFSTLHGMPVRTSDDKGIRVSVRLSVKRVHCKKTKERSVQIFNHTKEHFV